MDLLILQALILFQYYVAEILLSCRHLARSLITMIRVVKGRCALILTTCTCIEQEDGLECL